MKTINFKKAFCNNFMNSQIVKSLLPEAFKIDILVNNSLDHLHAKVNSSNIFANVYNKEVLACVLNPELLNSNLSYEVKEKAKYYLSSGIKAGAYSDSKGALLIRRNLAKWYKERDGFEINEDNIYLTNGGINTYEHVVNFINNPGESVLIPNPCNPFIINFNISYGLNNITYDCMNATIDFNSLKNTLIEARSKGHIIKSILIINPHDPLGHIMSVGEMERIIEFCEDNQLVLISNEMLQNSLYEGKFVSFRKIVNIKKSKLELFSLNSISKGPLYNNAIRAGILDIMNLEPEVEKELYKYKSIDLCSNLPGQILTDLVLNGPNEFSQEFKKKYYDSIELLNNDLKGIRDSILVSLKEDRKTEAGTSIFVKYPKDEDLFADISGKQLKIRKTLGKYYGNNLDSYVNFHIENLK